jgi:hypothetical protein
VAVLSDIIDVETTYYEEATQNKECKDDMIEEYQSIEDYQSMVLILKQKIVVSSKWIYI